jgi:hypothetical protein
MLYRSLGDVPGSIAWIRYVLYDLHWASYRHYPQGLQCLGYLFVVAEIVSNELSRAKYYYRRS